MKVIYTGPNPLAYHSSPSGFDYLFDPGVAQEVKKEDQTFWKSMIAAKGSDFKLGGWKTKLEEKVVESGKDAYAKNKKKIEGGKQ